MNHYTCSKVVVGLVPRLALGSDEKDSTLLINVKIV